MLLNNTIRRELREQCDIFNSPCVPNVTWKKNTKENHQNWIFRNHNFQLSLNTKPEIYIIHRSFNNLLPILRLWVASQLWEIKFSTDYSSIPYVYWRYIGLPARFHRQCISTWSPVHRRVPWSKLGKNQGEKLSNQNLKTSLEIYRVLGFRSKRIS